VSVAWNPQLRRLVTADEAQVIEPHASLGALSAPRSVSFAMALAAAIDEFEVDRDELVSSRKFAALVDARTLIVWAMRTIGEPRGYGYIGRLIKRTIPDVIHLHQRAIRRRIEDPFFSAACLRLAERHFTSQETSHGCL